MKKKSLSKKSLWLIVGGIVAGLLGGYVMIYRVQYKPEEVVSFMRREIEMDKQTDNIRIIFIHHSTGRFLIKFGSVRKLLDMKNEQNGTQYEFWDHDYNRIGLSDPTGKRLRTSFDIPDDNTDPDGYEVLFSQPVHDPPDNALSYILSFDVIIFKSCFPVSSIHDDAQLERYKEHYLVIQKVIADNPQKLFIVMTPPPLIPQPFPRYPQSASTNPDDAARAREFSRWLQSEEFLAGLPNVVTFDFFDTLANPEDAPKDANMLRAEYRSLWGLDSHPNSRANRDVAPLFVDFIFSSITDYVQSGP